MSEVINSKRLGNRQAAHYIGVAPQSLNNMRHLRQGPDYIKIGRKVLYDTKDLDRFLASNRVTLSSDERGNHAK